MKKYKEDILNFLLFGIMIFSIVISRGLNNLDEIWIFNMARNIANGLLPYKDFSMIVTPGLPIICGTILKVFGTEMFVMRILAAILNTIIIFMIYKILKFLNINKYLLTFISIAIMSLFTDFFCIDYNFAILMIALIILYIELKKYNKNKNMLKYDIKIETILGILAGIAITMKQTNGLCLAIVTIGYKLLVVRNKEELITFIKISINRAIAVIIPILLMIIYFISNGIMEEFIDYAILGISDFSNSKQYIELLKGEVCTLAIIVPIIIISSLIISVKNKDNILMILFAYSLSTIVAVYPIADTIHFLIAGIIAIITGIYMLTKLCDDISDRMQEKDKILIGKSIKVITIIALIVILLISPYKIIRTIIKFKEYQNLVNFKYIPVTESQEEKILKVGQYIKDKEEVYILDSSAALYMIPLNRYNKNYDMFMAGNFGAKGSKGLIEDLESKGEIEILIVNDEYPINWQTPMEVIEYIKNDYIKIGEIEKFDIYKKGE